MILEDLKKTYEPTMPGFDLIDAYEAGIPVYRTRLKVDILRKQEIPATAEFALKLVELGLNTESLIAQALGLEARFTRDALVYLDAQQLVQQKYHQGDVPTLVFAPSVKGKKALAGALST